MEQYNKLIAANPKVEFIHASLDDDMEDATKWAKRAKFPWPTVFPDQHEAAGLGKLMEIGAPESVLIDKDGTVLTRDEAEAFARIAELNEPAP